MKNSRSKLLEAARKMPPLYHTLPNGYFDIQKSEVIKWLITQPEILNYIWNNLKNSGVLVYNSETGRWKGVDY